jgi:hypothetical protein
MRPTLSRRSQLRTRRERRFRNFLNREHTERIQEHEPSQSVKLNMPSRKSPPGQPAHWPRPLLPIPRLRNSALPVGILQCPGSSDSPLPAPDRPHAYTDQLRPGWSRFPGWHRPRLAGRIGGHPVGDAEKCTGRRSATNRTTMSGLSIGRLCSAPGTMPSCATGIVRTKRRGVLRGDHVVVAEQNQRWCGKTSGSQTRSTAVFQARFLLWDWDSSPASSATSPTLHHDSPVGCGPRCRVADGERAPPRRRMLRGCRVSSLRHRTLRRCGGVPARSPRAGRRTWTDAGRGSRFPGASVRRRSTRSCPDPRV